MTLLEISACGAVLILAAAVLRRLRLPKEACMALWWASAARLLLPWKLPARCSVYTLLEALRTPPPAASVPLERPVAVLPPLEARPVVPVTPQSVPVPAEPFPVWTALWLAGAGLLAAWFLISYIRWRRRFREALPAEGDFLARWQAERRRVRVRVSDRIAAPLTYGLLRPVILLPKTMDLSDEEALLCVLTHEDIHIRRLDGLLKLLLTAAVCLHWFNPAAWLLWVLASRDMELRCDQAAVLRLGADRRAGYALTLLRMAELRNESMPLFSSFSERGMEERIKAIMKFKKPSALALSAALALVLCVTAVFATSAWRAPAEPEASGDPSAEAAPSPAEALQALEDSVRFEEGTFWFTIPAGEGRWNIWISGRLLTEDGGGMSVHYLEEESEAGEWTSRMTYSFLAAEADYDELTMTAAYGGEEAVIDLTPFLPEGLAPLETPELPEGKEDVPEEAEMVWPVDRENVSAAAGSFNPDGDGGTVHSGVDIAGMEKGEPVYAAGNGTVKDAGFNSHDGNYVLLDHGNGLETYYSSCGKVLVKKGETVKMAQTIATVGQSGMSTGPHLHFEVRKDGAAQNPIDYLDPGAGLGYAAKSVLPSVSEAGQPFYAPMDGTVLYAYQTSYGYLELVMDYGGEACTYSNCESVAVKPGDKVKQDDLLGTAKGPMSFGSGNPVDTTDKMLSELARDYLIDGEYPRNKNGQTYAPNETLAAIVGYPPDLVHGYTTDGQLGYISLEELHTTSHLLWGAWKSKTDLDATEPRSIPVYDEEGAVIGEFIINPPGEPTRVIYDETEDGEGSLTVIEPGE